MVNEKWHQRERQWAAFHAWEARDQAAKPQDPASALAWMSEAWELAARYDPDWLSGRIDMEKVQRLMQERAALARLGGPR